MKKNIDAMNHPTKVKETIGERIYTIVVYLLLILISATIILPLLHIISGSFSDPMQPVSYTHLDVYKRQV